MARRRKKRTRESTEFDKEKFSKRKDSTKEYGEKVKEKIENSPKEYMNLKELVEDVQKEIGEDTTQSKIDKARKKVSEYAEKDEELKKELEEIKKRTPSWKYGRLAEDLLKQKDYDTKSELVRDIQKLGEEPMKEHNVSGIRRKIDEYAKKEYADKEEGFKEKWNNIKKGKVSKEYGEIAGDLLKESQEFKSQSELARKVRKQLGGKEALEEKGRGKTVSNIRSRIDRYMRREANGKTKDKWIELKRDNLNFEKVKERLRKQKQDNK